MAIHGLAAGLRAIGHTVVRVPSPELPLPLDLRRLVYNLTLPPRLRGLAFDRAVGFDFDGALAGHRTGPGYTVALKGVLADEARFERGPVRWRLRALSHLERRNARRAHTVVVTSEYSRRAACRAYGLEPASVRVVPEGIDPAFWSPGPPGGADGTGSGPARDTVLSVARQYPRKDTSTLLGAFELVLERRPGTRLRIVGDGPELPRLRREAARLGIDSDVRFVGAVEGTEEVRAEYRAADVFCLPSLQEGFGIAFLEAMAVGLPVVGARAGAVPEVVPEAAGVLVDGRDPEALADALLRLLADPGLRRRMGDAGREHALGLAWPEVARRFLRAVGWSEDDSAEVRGSPTTRSSGPEAPL